MEVEAEAEAVDVTDGADAPAVDANGIPQRVDTEEDKAQREKLKQKALETMGARDAGEAAKAQKEAVEKSAGVVKAAIKKGGVQVKEEELSTLLAAAELS